ncbi:aldo/keto reductase [Soehngenia saccharolytica]|nr:aldo/keto reductase [Soehngenia saccharolytica]
MQYSYFTNDRLKVSQLGFGCMRFPILNGDQKAIDEEKAREMLIYAIENGVNYIDTAYPYHGGMSEKFVGKVLSEGYRDKVYLATKNPVWLANAKEDFMKYLDEQLDNLKTDHIDFYLLHSLDAERFDKIVDLEVFDFVKKAKDEGKIKYIGFSFHDEYEVFEKIVDSYDWDFCQIQLNYLDRDYQAGLKGLKYAKDKGLDVVVMEPVKGGKLAKAPEKIKNVFSRANVDRSPAQWALKWVLDKEEVSVVLSGMTTLEQVKENIAVASENTKLTPDEIKLIDEATKIYKDGFKVGCTACEYCMPCPSGVNIPRVFELYNNVYVFDELDESKRMYQRLIENNMDASNCVECGSCEAVCPQHLSIIELLKEADKVLR